MLRFAVILMAALSLVHCSAEPDTGTSSGTLVVTLTSPAGVEKLLFDTLTDIDFNHSAGDYERTIGLNGSLLGKTGNFNCHITADVDSGYVIEATGCGFTRTADERWTFMEAVTGAVSFPDDLIEVELIGSSEEQPDVVVEVSFVASYKRY